MPITGKSLRASLNKEITKRAYVNTCSVWPRFQLYECFCVSITLFLSKELHEITLYLDVTIQIFHIFKLSSASSCYETLYILIE